jgi:hypothetical protein
MYKFNAREFLYLSNMLSGLQSELELLHQKENTSNTTLSEGNRVWLSEQLDALKNGCADMGLELSMMLVDAIKTSLAQESYTSGRFVSDVKELQRRVDHEISSPLFLVIPHDRAVYYEQPELFGSDVAVKYPAAGYDIQEAGNCYATGRNTACVMHLMRSLEVALDAVGLGAGVPNAVIEAKNSWETLLKKIDAQIVANDKSGDVTWQPKRQFFVDAHAHLFAVKNAWRNPSMHLERKYDEREALRIYNAVKDFMEHLATHVDGSGQFTP